MKLHKIPTGVGSLDLAIRGGLPSGSFVILLGEAGAGHTEFAYTSALMLSKLKSDAGLLARMREEMVSLLDSGEDISIPDRICYISLTKSKADVLSEIARIFGKDSLQSLDRYLIFKDLSRIYFMDSLTPPSWVDEEARSLSSLKNRRSMEEELIRFLNSTGNSSLIILDSLTSLVRYCGDSIRWRDLVFFLQGLQRVSKTWGGLIYGLLDAKILGESRQEELLSLADGALIFEWEEAPDKSRKQSLYVKKFRGLLPQLASDKIAKFETSVRKGSGFEMTHVKVVIGKK